MIRRACFTGVWLLIFASGHCPAAKAQSDKPHSAMEQVLERCRQQLLREARLSPSAVASLLDSQNSDGTWPDIDYVDDSKSHWQPLNHMERLRDMAQAYASAVHIPRATPELRTAILRSLDHWLLKRYQSSNWWHNQIGVPRFMRDIVVLFGSDIDDIRRGKALGVIGQHQLRGSGANLAWSAELALHQACLTQDTDRAEAVARRLWNEVTIGAPEGIQPDWSFYQHGPRLQSYHYGRSFFDVAGYTAWQLRGTPWQIPKDKRDLLSNFLLEGQQWMCRGIYTVPGTMDRMVSRKGSLAMADLRILLGLWKDVHPERKEPLTAFSDRQSSATSPQLDGFRAFPYGDFYAYHRPEFSLFLKTVSSRTQPTESINGENLKGVPYLNTGDHYLLRGGKEYSDLQPLWKWEQLPGLTMAQGLETLERLPFTGGAGNGRSGTVTMDYRRTGPKDEAVLHIRKLWGFHNGMMICLISGVEAKGGSGEIMTSLEQSRLAGPVVWKAPRTSKGKTIAEGANRTQEAAWVLHNGVGYMPLPRTAKLAVQTETRTGSWKTINAGYEDTPVSAPLFALQLVHDIEPGTGGVAAGGFAIIGKATEQSLETIASQPPWTIVRNDSRCQHLRFADGVEMAAYYEVGEAPDAGTGTGSSAAQLAVDTPCLIMWNDQDLWICDPTHEGRKVSVSRGNQVVALPLPPHGTVLHHVWTTGN